MSSTIGHLNVQDRMMIKKSSLQDKKGGNTSDTDGSDSNSLSQESLADKPSASSSKHLPRRTSEWEILEGLKDGQRYEKKPEPFKGYLQKKRKWPLKGWHKRFFILETGILKYGKSPQDLSKGKIHGQVDIGLSVISTKSKRKRIDIDTEEFIYHLKAKQYEVFEEWMEQLKNHRLYRQHLLTFGSRITSTDDDEIPLKQPLTRKLANEGSPAQRLQWVLDGPLQVAMTELNHTQQALNQLSKILDNMEHGNPDSESIIEGFSPNVKKDRKRFGLRKKKSNKGSSVDLTSFNRDEHNPQTLSPGGSISNRPLSGEQNPGAALPIVDLSSASDFYILAKDICTSLKSVIYTLQTEKEKLKGSSDEKLRNLLSTMVQQNTELRTRLSQVHKQSDTSDIPDGIQTRSLKSSLSYSSCASEYLDAKESLEQSETSSPAVSSEDLSDSSAISDLADSEYNATIDFPSTVNETANLTGRRSTLPVPRPSTEGLSLWNLLSRNIGKDLSQVSMPVALNEPLSMLQVAMTELNHTQQALNQLSKILDNMEHGNPDSETLSPGGSISNRPLSGEQNPGAALPIVDLSSASDFYILAKDICTSLKSVIYTLQTEKEKLKGSSDEKLRNLLSTMVQQNTELRTRLSQVHKQSDTSDIPDGIQTRSLKSSLSYSSCASEYLDAKESLEQSETSSPAVSSEDLSDSSAISDLADSEYNATIDFPSTVNETANLTGRRSTLPVPRPSTEGLSLWNLLSRNIGKDLSQVSMPVALNEPLSMLQRMCEELEYSELLDKASELSDPFERMVYVAAFAVSAYGSSYFRAGSKPFNPLLGETYECIREDKGFRFIAEQVISKIFCSI
ncbi:unnamed protein product [Nezara viridula]|uniref:PH domain-containing protein n=1 Tax=Nezara viridula TaxID=85310 RepID=A0A9P0H065_NEZVI|nr:unnamed protein product [Nezara viridula]